MILRNNSFYFLASKNSLLRENTVGNFEKWLILLENSTTDNDVLKRNLNLVSRQSRFE